MAELTYTNDWDLLVEVRGEVVRRMGFCPVSLTALDHILEAVSTVVHDESPRAVTRTFRSIKEGIKAKADRGACDSCGKKIAKGDHYRVIARKHKKSDTIRLVAPHGDKGLVSAEIHVECPT